jgi:hypothetical protein
VWLYRPSSSVSQQVRKGSPTFPCNLLVVGVNLISLALWLTSPKGANVWVTSGSEEKIKWAVGHGANGGLNYKDGLYPTALHAVLHLPS